MSVFLLIYLWWTALDERAGTSAKKSLSSKSFAVFAVIVFFGAFGLNAYRARMDILKPYSMGEKTAAFLAENGYDSADALILATHHPMVSTILGFTKNVETLRFVYGDCSYSVWQVYDSDYEHSFDLSEFIRNELESHGDEYRAVLFVGRRMEYPFGGSYPAIFDSGGESIMSDESYVILRLK